MYRGGSPVPNCTKNRIVGAAASQTHNAADLGDELGQIAQLFL